MKAIRDAVGQSANMAGQVLGNATLQDQRVHLLVVERWGRPMWRPGPRRRCSDTTAPGCRATPQETSRSVQAAHDEQDRHRDGNSGPGPQTSSRGGCG